MGMGVPKFGGSPKFCDTGRVSTAFFFFGTTFNLEFFWSITKCKVQLSFGVWL